LYYRQRVTFTERLQGATFAVFLLSCGGATPEGDEPSNSEATSATTCSVVAPRACPAPAPHYADVEPILAERCAHCHSEAWDGPWPLTTYEDVSSWQHELRAQLVSCSMPPPESEFRLTPEESELILVWLRCGAPR
jgi:uncharacterized membrane protein